MGEIESWKKKPDKAKQRHNISDAIIATWTKLSVFIERGEKRGLTIEVCPVGLSVFSLASIYLFFIQNWGS